MHRFANRIEPVSDWGYFLFAFFLPFPISVSRIFIFVLLILQLVEFWKVKSNHFKYHLSSFLLPLLFALYAISLLYTKDLTGGIKQLEKAVPLLILSLAFLFRRVDEKRVRGILQAFVAGLLVMCIFLLGRALYNSMYLESGSLIFDPRVLRDPRITYIHSVNWGGNYFFSDAFVDFMHPSYFGMYLVFSLVSILYLSRAGSLSPRSTWVFASIFTITLFLSSARASHLSAVVVAVVVLFYGKLYATKIKIYALIILMFLSSVFVILNPRWVEFSDMQDMIDEKIEYRGSVPERLMSWDASWDLIEKKLIFGYGIGDVQGELNRSYQKLNYERPLKESHNAHNQFLQTMLISGTLGLMVLFLVFINLIRIFNRTRQILVLAFLLIILVHFTFESMLERYAGVAFFSFFYGLLNTLSLEKTSDI